MLAKEIAKKQSARQNPAFKEKEKISQLLSKQSARQNPAFKEKEKNCQLLSKQSARKNVNVLAKELAKKQSARQNPAFKEKEKISQLASKQCARKNVDVLAKELDRKRSDRQNPAFKEKERVNQLASKQSARKSVDMLEKECVRKQFARQNPDFREKEKIYQLASKQKKRQSSFVLECERIAQQQRRQNKRKFEKDTLELNGQKKRCKIAEEKSQKMGPYAAYDKKRHDSVVECLKQFEENIAVGPLFVCTCCHQTWFRKSVSLLKNTNIRRCSLKYCTKLKSVNSEEWICHTCLSALKDGKIPKLSVANGMKWPNKPPELDLHQLEERLIALRIPFMQIRELPRGGQYSLKGNVINVPVDIQPTVNSLPRPMDENFTVAIQLKKKLSYKKVDFKENVRPMRVLTALHWLLTNSDMYENSGITVDTNWFQAVTESAEDTVREFLEVPVQNTNPDINVNNAILDEEKTHPSVPQDRNKGDGYDSDGFSEVDSNEHVGNLDTLVDDANIENKFDQVLTFAPGEGRHPLSLYQDTDAEYLCFPTIFCGQRRPNDTERTILVHYSDIVKWELRSIDRRAAQSVPNIFFKHKKLQMKQISDKVNLAVRRCKNKGKKITAAEARDPAYLERLVKLDEGYCIFRQLRNSPAYLEKRKKDIFAMIRQLSLPTWFVSLSAADTRWNDLLKMLAKLNDAIEYSDKDVEALTWQEKTRLVQKDPVTCSRYFDHRVQEFLNTVLKNEIEPIGKVLDFFYRVEFQQRGSPHIHMLIWIENAPKLEKNTEEEIIQFVDNYLTCSTDDEEIGELVELQSHKHSKSCRKKGKAICRFGFPLPPFPRTLLLHPLDEDVEKYKKQYSELQKTMNEYKNVTDITFDEFLEQVAKMNLENYIKCIRSSLRAPKIFLKRNPNEMRVNLFNKTILLGWKANLDIQMVLEPYGCATYVVGYISKSQRGMSAQLDAAAREARKGNFDIKKQVRHIGNVFSNCVEVSAQEAVYLALQIPLTKATRDIVFINTSIPEERIFLLKSKSVLDELPAESTNIEADNIIQRYAKRPRQLEKFCLADYVSTVDIVYPKGNRLSVYFVYFNPDRVVEHRQYDIGIEIQSVCSVPAVEINGAMLPDEQYINLVRSLNLRQREFFNHVLYWLKCKEEPLYAFLSGGAGVGKSVLIKALYQSLYRFLNLREGENPDDIRVLLCAYTGKAAYNINGVTIASAFLKKFKQSGDLLSADELNTFRVKYRHLKVIIIDEISMVGTNTLTFLDTRLQQLTGTKANFGGLSIIAVGDLYQLMPVCDKWIFSDPSKGASALAYNLWRDYFRLYELVDIMRQKDDADFAQMLNRLRQNELTEDDKNELKKHSISPHMTNYPKEAPHLFTENRFVDKHNENYLNRLSEDKVIIPCHDTVVSANISINKCRKLIEALPDDSNKTANLPKLLTVAVGMIYDITVNVNVADGLTNGSTCVVKFIEYKMEGTDRPSIIWVLFQDSQIGQSTREKFLNRGLYSTNIDKAWTPIFDIERTFIYNFKTYQRIQFPLKPAAGKTIHKAQGSTVDEIVVDLSQTRVRKQPHIHYVALSRVRKLENLYILNLNEAAMAVDEQVKIEMQRLKTEALLELCYVPLYKVDPHKIKVAFNNARSLHKHFKDIEFEPNVLSADVIGFAESRLCTRDDNSYFALKNFKLLRMDETGHDSANRPYHGLALYIKDYFEIQRIEKFHSDICEFMFVTMYSNMKRCFQVVYFYKFPKSTQINLRNAIQHHLIPLVDMHTKLVIIGDFNIDANDSASSFVDFMIKQFKCEQHINQSTTDSGSVIDLIFTNCPASSDVIEAYWSDHKLVYCALDA